MFGGQRITGMVAHQARFPVMPTKYSFTRHGRSGIALSDLLPEPGKSVDEICLIRSAHTEAINHDPAITFFQTGSQLPGKAVHGSLAGLRARRMNQNMRLFVVMVSTPSEGTAGGACWRAFGLGLPCRADTRACSSAAGADPVLYLSDPPG